MPRGGASGYGTVCKITNSGTLTAIYNFSGPDGVYPSEGLTLGSDGNFYGATSGDGMNIYATIFNHTIGNADHTSQFH